MRDINMRPNNFHYDTENKVWDNNYISGTGVYKDYQGWYCVYFDTFCGSLSRSQHFSTENDAREWLKQHS